MSIDIHFLILQFLNNQFDFELLLFVITWTVIIFKLIIKRKKNHKDVPSFPSINDKVWFDLCTDKKCFYVNILNLGYLINKKTFFFFV